MARGLVVACAFLVASCKTKRDEPVREILPVPVGTIRVDSVPDGELAEGTVDAFGLRLPRGMRLEASFDDALFAGGAFSLERVSNYLRKRVEAEHVETAAKKTVFRHATLEGSKVVLHIEVLAASVNKVQVIVRNETPKPPTQGLSEEQRWKQVGLGPDGKRVLPAANE